MAGGLTIAPESRDELERVVGRLLAIAGRCGDAPAIQHGLMQLGDELAKIIDETSLERVVVRLLAIAARCGNAPAIQHGLMQLGDELATIIDEISAGGTACGGAPIPQK